MDLSTLALRVATDADLPFLQQVYESVRTDELAPLPWSAEQKRAFLEMQHQAQHQHYTSHYPGAQFNLVLLAGEPIGRLYVHRVAHELRLMDIALLPAWRGRGIGQKLLQALLAEAEAAALPLVLYVEQFNPAYAWYGRLGFREVGEHGVYKRMEWRADAQPKTA
jgi:ribosomal protein S18 acetylase RimI-like enzyme